MKSSLLVAAFASVWVFAPVSAQTYTLIDLGSLGGGYSMGYGINANGHVTGSSTLNERPRHAFLYDGNTMQDLGTLGGTYSDGYGINANGQVTGSGNVSGDSTRHAFLYDGNTMQDLGTLGDTHLVSAGWGINDNGLVTGYSESNDDGSYHAFLYDGNTMQDLGTLGGRESIGYGINASGQVTGHSHDSGNASHHAFLYDGNTMQDLGTLGGTKSVGYGINDSGQVTGWAATNDNFAHAFLYDGSTMQDLGTMGRIESVGYGINNSGHVVGHYGDPDSNDYYANDYHAFFYDGSQMIDLCELTDCVSAGWERLREAWAINDNGDITGRGIINGEWHAFLVLNSSPPPTENTFNIDPKNDVVSENGSSASFTVSRTDNSAAQTVYVSTVQNLGWSNYGDYAGKLNEQLLFDVGVNQLPLTVNVYDDLEVEDDEKFGLIVQERPTDPVSEFLASATFMIHDNDTVPPPSDEKPVLNGLFPPAGVPGDKIIAYGGSFGTQDRIFIDGQLISPLRWGDTSIQFIVPSLDPGKYKLEVRTSGGTAKTRLEVLPPQPIIEKVSPGTGTFGTTAIVEGYNFGRSQGVGQIEVGGIIATAVSWSDQRVAFRVPLLERGKYQVRFTTVSGQAEIPFTVRNSSLQTERGECDETIVDLYVGTCMVLIADPVKQKQTADGVVTNIRLENIRRRWYDLHIQSVGAMLPQDLPTLIGPKDRKGAWVKYINGVVMPPGSEVSIMASSYPGSGDAMAMHVLDMVSRAIMGKPIPANNIDAAIYLVQSVTNPLGDFILDVTTHLVEGSVSGVIADLKSLPEIAAKDPLVRNALISIGISQSAMATISSIAFYITASSIVLDELYLLTTPGWDGVRIYAE